jgi:formate transporter
MDATMVSMCVRSVCCGRDIEVGWREMSTADEPSQPSPSPSSGLPNPQASGAAVNKITNLSDEEIYHDLHVSQRLLLSPLEIYVKARHLGETKPHMEIYKSFFLSVLGGIFISLGAATTFIVGGNLNQAPWYPDETQHNYGVYKLVVGAFGYQMGFTALSLLGADLFTSHCCYSAVAWFENRISTFEVCKVLSIVWIGNFCGALMAAGIFDAGEVFDGHDDQLQLSTNDKLTLPFRVIVARAVLANFLVAITALTQASALDTAGKILAIFLPLFTFAAFGFEHCIANMFILPMGCMQQASECSIHKVLYRNLLPATVGNWLGGVFMAILLAITLGHPEKRFLKPWNHFLEFFHLKEKHPTLPGASKDYEMTAGHEELRVSGVSPHHQASQNGEQEMIKPSAQFQKRTGFRVLNH